LTNATNIRNLLNNNNVNKRPEFELDIFSDIKKLSGNEVLEALEQSYRQVGKEETIVITRTNKRTNLYNQGIRNRILWKDDQISNGDRLMVTKNNYFWTKEYEGIEFLANGDMFEIKRIRHFHEMYGYQFAEASLKSVDYDWEIDALVWLDTLFTDSPEYNYSMQQTLFERISEDYPEIRNKRDMVKAVMENKYFNALQIRFAYAVTCHKAQGGQWQHVYIDQGTLQDDQIDTDYYRWLYTALTRATQQIYLINF
jgi:exodeoxyribonuclease-5